MSVASSFRRHRQRCVAARNATLRNRRNASREALGEAARLGTVPGRDVQALGAYFCRIFFRFGDADRSPSMKLSGDGWSFMMRRDGWS
jgi:hypothetical protein